jgi:integrase
LHGLAELAPRLARYLAEIRPRFPGAAAHRALWAGRKGRGLGGAAVYGAIAARTRAAFGRAVGPHLFRDCAATTIAIARPGQVGVARDLLGHAALATTNAHYNQARSIEASRLHAEILAACRAAGVPVTTVMSGGYAEDINDTVEIHCNTIRAAKAVFDGVRFEP